MLTSAWSNCAVTPACMQCLLVLGHGGHPDALLEIVVCIQAVGKDGCIFLTAYPNVP